MAYPAYHAFKLATALPFAATAQRARFAFSYGVGCSSDFGARHWFGARTTPAIAGLPLAKCPLATSTPDAFVFAIEPSADGGIDTSSGIFARGAVRLENHRFMPDSNSDRRKRECIFIMGVHINFFPGFARLVPMSHKPIRQTGASASSPSEIFCRPIAGSGFGLSACAGGGGGKAAI